MPRTTQVKEMAEDADFAFQEELEQVADDNTANFVAATMNNWELWKRIVAVEGRASDSNPVFFSPSGADYIRVTSHTYEVRANNVYRGTGVWTPNTLIVMVSRSKSNGVGYFRVYDFDNTTEICERTFTNVGKTTHVFTLTPTEIARFQPGVVDLEFQLRRDGNAGIYLHAAGLYIT